MAKRKGSKKKRSRQTHWRIRSGIIKSEDLVSEGIKRTTPCKSTIRHYRLRKDQGEGQVEKDPGKTGEQKGKGGVCRTI